MNLGARQQTLRHQRRVWPSVPDNDDLDNRIMESKGIPHRPPKCSQGDLSKGRLKPKSKYGLPEAKGVEDSKSQKSIDVQNIPIHEYSFHYAMNYFKHAPCAVHGYEDIAACERAMRLGSHAHVRALWRKVVVGAWGRKYKYIKRPTSTFVAFQNRKIVAGLLPAHERFKSRVPSPLGPGRAETLLTPEQTERIMYWGKCLTCDASKTIGL